MRLQLALNVRDLEEAIAYYGELFNAEPHKRHPGYANFAIDQPPLKLVLFENVEATERLNHLGVEAFADAEVTDAEQRLRNAGILTQVQRDETCCHATQNKVWSSDPQGLRWEWYRIIDDQPVERACSDEKDSCCA